MRRRTFLTTMAGGIASAVTVDQALGAPAHAISTPGLGPTAPRAPLAALAALGFRPSMMAGERGIIYSETQQRVWVVDEGFALLKTHRVSGRIGNPPLGNYRVFSKAPRTFSIPNPAVQWNYMVRFCKTKKGNNIGFHQIPERCTKNGKCTPIQSVGQLGTPLSAGCVRQKRSDALWIYNWSQIGTLVVVIR